MRAGAEQTAARPAEPTGTTHIEPYTESRRHEWDAFISAHPLAGYGHYSATFALAACGRAVNHSLMLYEEGRLQGVLPLFAVPERVLRAVPVTSLRSGFGFPAGPLLAATAARTAERHQVALVRAAVDLADHLGCDEVRIGYPTVTGDTLAIDRFGYLPLRDFGFTETNVVSLVLDLAREPSFERTATYACRQSIRRAQELGASVSIISDGATWELCDVLNRQTMGPLVYSRAEMDVIWREFIETGLATAFVCMLDGEIASVIVSIRSGTTAYYWLGFNRRPPARGTAHLTLRAAIAHAQEKGARYFELGSKEFSHPKQMAISRFKESFGGCPCYALEGQLERRPVKKALIDLAQAAAGRLRARRRVSASPTSE